MLLEKYQPKEIKGILGQSEVIDGILSWLKKPEKPLLIYGPSGIGKSMIPKIIAKQMKFKLIEINPNDLNCMETLKSASKESSLFGVKIILIDEIENLDDLTGVCKILEGAKHPIILVADNAWNPKFKELRSKCELIRMRKINVNTIENELKIIARNEKIKINEKDIKEIAKNSDGDLRSAIIDLENFSSGFREREKNIFDILKIIFKTMNFQKSLNAIKAYDDADYLFWWIEENIPREYEKPEEIAKAFDLLSKADIFKARTVRNQNFVFRTHSINLLAAIALAKQKPYYKFTKYRPPDRLLILSENKIKRNEENEKCKNLGNILHCSKRNVRNQMPYLQLIMGN